MKLNRLMVGWLLAFAALTAQPFRVGAQIAAFTYQGRLNGPDGPVTGLYNLTFTLYGVPTNGAPVANTITNSATPVTNGLFAVTLGFDSGAFDGSARWLELGVSTNGGAIATLAPRQALTPSPYATYADKSGSAITASQATYAPNAGVADSVSSVSASAIIGVIGLQQLPAALVTNGETAVTLAGSFSGNGAGLSDVDLANVNSRGAIGWVTNGWGDFVLSTILTNAGSAAYSADVNADGRADILSQNGGSTLVYSNRGNGGFAMVSTVATNGPLALGDINGDGRTDLVFSAWSQNAITVWTNNGRAVFSLSQTYATGLHPGAILVKDLNGDGKADVTVAINGNSTLLVLTNNGAGALTASSTPSVGVSPSDIQSADLNGDGRPDLVTAEWGGTVTVLTNAGAGRFASNSTVNVTNGTRSVALADVNGDGRVDIVCATPYGGSLMVLTNTGSGGFAFCSAPLPNGIRPDRVVAADFNGDGMTELISCDMFGAASSLLTNNGSGVFTLNTVITLPGTAPSPGYISVADLNGDGHPDLMAPELSTGAIDILMNSPVLGAVFAGNGAYLANLDAGHLGTGTVSDLRLSTNVSLLGASQVFSGTNRFTGAVTATNMANRFSGAFTGNGAGLTNLNAGSAFATGTLADARLSTNVARLNATQTFTGVNSFLASVGIGTASPQGGLDVNTGAGNIQFRNDSNVVAAVNVVNGPNSGTLRLHNRLEVWPNDARSMAGSLDIRGTNGQAGISLPAVGNALLNGGNVGIGDGAPASLLTVSRTVAGGRGGELSIVNGAVRTVGSEAALNFGVDDSTYHGDFGNAQIKARLRSTSDNRTDLLMSTWSGSSFGERLCIQYDGNVGIGTSSPGGKLDIATEGGTIQFRNEGGAAPGINITNSLHGVLRFRNELQVWPNDAGTSAGRVSVRDTSGTETIVLNGATGEGTVKVLTITGGSDIAEPFLMPADVVPGTVVVIDEDHPGELKASDRAYDTRVAGIVSGANGVTPGLALHQKGVLEGTRNVALTGRVYARADTSNGSIKPGDLLTTSDVPGHCMKVTDATRAHGTVLGKAMSALKSGEGLVLVLVNLQ
jgi:hypothetical protein